MAELIKKETTTLQLRFAKPYKHGNACSSVMVTCVVPLLTGGIMGSSKHYTNWQGIRRRKKMGVVAMVVGMWNSMAPSP
jgi:hypothetical protein